MPTDLPDAVVQHIAPVIPAAADYAGQIAFPYAVVEEIGEDFEYESFDSGGTDWYIGSGTLRISIRTTNRPQARSLGWQLIRILKDAQLTFDTGLLLELRPRHVAFIPELDVATSVPAMFNRILIMQYKVQRS